MTSSPIEIETQFNDDCRTDYITFKGVEPDAQYVLGCLVATFREQPAASRLTFELGDYACDLIITSPADLDQVINALDEVTGPMQRLNWGETEEGSVDRSDGSARFTSSTDKLPTSLEIMTYPKDPLVKPEDLIAGLIKLFSPTTEA